MGKWWQVEERRKERTPGKESTTCNGLENIKQAYFKYHENVEREVSVERHEYI